MSRDERHSQDSDWSDARGTRLLPIAGVVCVLMLWSISSPTWSTDLPSPSKTWEVSKLYRRRAVREARRTGSGHPALHLVLAGARREGLRARAADRHAARVPARPLEAVHGAASIRSSRSCGRCRRWRGCRWDSCCSRSSKPAALFTIAICSMWPTVLNTAVGVRADPAGLSERRARAEAVAREDASSRSCCPRRCRTCSRAFA